MVKQQSLHKVFALMTVLTVLVLPVFSACSNTQVPSPYQSPNSSPASSPSRAETSLRPPNAPSNLLGQASSPNIVLLQWTDTSLNEDGFRVYRDGTVVATLKPNITTYQDTGLKSGKTYNYQIKAFNAAGESGSQSYAVKTPNPPLSVTIDYVGVKFDHDPSDLLQGPGDIRLVILITDGIHTVQEIIPPGEGTFQINDYQTIPLNQRVFQTDSVGDYLKISVIAWDDDPETAVSDTLRSALPILGAVFGMPALGTTADILSQYQEKTGKPLFENKDDFVGYFESSWGANESWGIGQYKAVGTSDLRLWFSIWSDSQPASGPKPTLSPDVTIQNTDVPLQVIAGKEYSYHVTLRNNESRPATVTLKIRSSLTGEVDSRSVTVPANNSVTITESTTFQPTGVRTVTYSLLYQGVEISSLSKPVEAKAATSTITPPPATISPTPTSTPTRLPLSVNFDGWYVGGAKVNSTAKQNTVIARISLSNGDPGQYKLRVRRDISLADDTTVIEKSFDYVGTSATIELSFKPPYSTNEASTNGYHLDIVKDGYVIWTLTNSYPPRLKVTSP